MELKQNPETLIVTRDGYLDDEYYDAVYTAKRKQALIAAGRELIHFAARAPIVAGRHLLELVTTDTLEAK